MPPNAFPTIVDQLHSTTPRIDLGVEVLHLLSMYLKMSNLKGDRVSCGLTE
jgi:hypothetical protein